MKTPYPEEKTDTKCISSVPNNNKDNLKLIYYFDGECGSCFLILKQISELMQQEFAHIEIRYVSSTPMSKNAERLIHDLRIKILIEQATDLEIEILNINHLHIYDQSERIIFSTNKIEGHYLMGELDKRLR